MNKAISFGAELLPATASSTTLRELILSNDLTFLMEAHDGLSAAIAERAGFRGLWASGLSIASALGYRDANEASWTQVVDVVERMVDATNIPVLVDGDSGFGNFNNARLVARKLEQRGASGICLEDKSFPKMNSFVGDRHLLPDIDEFCGRLKAVKDTTGPDFVVVARIEALIAGHSLDEALCRADAYSETGADAILIHSREAVADEILTFTKEWNNKLPVVIVPTKYYKTPASVYRDAGISTVIWANHSMRAAIAGMRDVCGRIRSEESIAGIEDQVAGLDELFRLMGYDELAEAEERYLPKQSAERRPGALDQFQKS
ncbi:phosphoenolpyruvate mutase [Mesorhizobium japonicum]|uniref:phosphoenolpyruvate mutase n=1 Tax=Mesorhizobium japonicum (strain LMG 29417 / CECT 9101 / MAFF 303099) TaxID=266835 RepID=Q982E4_RHILO|nr:phosphoenolpyruvate mutase [Mesorhizobium japonicum]BAB54515.1 phosphoenolpyruvate phosphomutase [Mesorhizobium japonicum MAFF 303099]